jgi:hypothetical protein
LLISYHGHSNKKLINGFYNGQHIQLSIKQKLQDVQYRPRVKNILTTSKEMEENGTRTSETFGMNSQSLAQTNACSISEVNELLVSPSILPPQLNADSDATVLRGIARKSRAID